MFLNGHHEAMVGFLIFILMSTHFAVRQMHPHMREVRAECGSRVGRMQ